MIGLGLAGERLQGQDVLDWIEIGNDDDLLDVRTVRAHQR